LKFVLSTSKAPRHPFVYVARPTEEELFSKEVPIPIPPFWWEVPGPDAAPVTAPATPPPASASDAPQP
jgi:hypothetical protein